MMSSALFITGNLIAILPPYKCTLKLYIKKQALAKLIFMKVTHIYCNFKMHNKELQNNFTFFLT